VKPNQVKLNQLVAFVTGTIVFLTAQCALAAMPVPYGWYAEANLGDSKAWNKPYPGSVQRTGFGYNFDGGYKFNTFVAGEVGISEYAPTRIKNSAGQQAAKDTHYSYDIAGKIMLPFGGLGVEAFGKLGVTRISSDETVNAANAALDGLVFYPGTHYVTGIYMAAGADYANTHHLLVNLQWARARGSNKTGNLDLYSGGLSYIL
jgi:hypothetical protein